jgi:hypothetical protein
MIEQQQQAEREPEIERRQNPAGLENDRLDNQLDAAHGGLRDAGDRNQSR